MVSNRGEIWLGHLLVYKINQFGDQTINSKVFNYLCGIELTEDAWLYEIFAFGEENRR